MEQELPQGKRDIRYSKKFLIALTVLVFVVGGFIFVGASKLWRSDEIILKTYRPAPEIAEIAEKNILTDKGKAIFYRADPKLVDGDTFKKYCPADGVEALACNAPKPKGWFFGERQIFILRIDDPRFADHKYAAAVHEMLHTAYNKLESSEKKRINTLLDKELARHKDDFHLMTTIDTLKKKSNDAGDVQEELHSKFGAEYSALSPELEEYYKQYFKDRWEAVKLYKKEGFNSRVTRMDYLKHEEEELSGKIATMRGQLKTYQNSGDMESYNSLIGEFDIMVYVHNAKVAESQRTYSEVQQLYQYFNPDYKPPENKIQ